MVCVKCSLGVWKNHKSSSSSDNSSTWSDKWRPDSVFSHTEKISLNSSSVVHVTEFRSWPQIIEATITTVTQLNICNCFVGAPHGIMICIRRFPLAASCNQWWITASRVFSCPCIVWRSKIMNRYHTGMCRLPLKIWHYHMSIVNYPFFKHI